MTSFDKGPPAPPKASDLIRARLKAEKKQFFANDSIHEFLQEGDKEALKKEVQQAVENLLDALVIDRENDHNTKDTARRVAKMYMEEVMMGRYSPPPELTEFPNAKKLDEIYTVGPIKIRSMCSHHFAPIIGQIWVGVIPGKNVIGLSKFNRLAHWVMSRPQIQEEAVIQLADELEAELEPIGLAIVIKADHFCMKWRGVKDDSSMANSVMRGVFKANPSAKQEFFDIIKGQGY